MIQRSAKNLEARFSATTIEIFHGGKRVASHARNSARYQHTTVTKHSGDVNNPFGASTNKVGGGFARQFRRV